MDTFSSNYGKERETDSEFAYPAQDFSAAAPAQPRPASTGFGFGLLKALRVTSAPAHPETDYSKTDTELDKGAHFAGFVASRPYVEPTPVYRGQYSKTCPLYFNTEPVDNANDTRLDRTKLTSYTRAQLFFLLRLERFLRLRHYWNQASPRQDEQWKTNLVLNSVFSALQDCIKHEVGEDAKTLLTRWGCC